MPSLPPIHFPVVLKKPVTALVTVSKPALANLANSTPLPITVAAAFPSDPIFERPVRNLPPN